MYAFMTFESSLRLSCVVCSLSVAASAAMAGSYSPSFVYPQAVGDENRREGHAGVVVRDGHAVVEPPLVAKPLVDSIETLLKYRVVF